jgi:chromosome segregation ATPase
MPIKTLMRAAALLSLGFLASLSTPAQDPASQQSPDPMADAARKARAQQQNAPKPKKIFTNDDIAPAQVSKPADSKTPSASADATSKDDKDAAAENDPKSEKYWRKRFSKAREKLASAEREADILQRELNKNEVQYYPDPQKALMQQYSRKDINDAQAKLDAKKKEIESLKQQISDLEDELRKAGGDPGWAR